MMNHDLRHSEEKIPLRSNSSCPNSSPEFDFCIRQNSKQRFSHADELFHDGKILPLGVTKKNIEAAPARTNLKTHVKSDKKCLRQRSDSENLNSGCGFWLTRSKSVGYCLRRTKKNDSSFVSVYGDVDEKKKEKKSLQKMNSTERASSNHALNVPLADMFCFGSGFSGGGEDRSKTKQRVHSFSLPPTYF